ncbi:MAG: leucine-rich repeat domain-containing protein [Ruminococcus sp.]|nr:leucine-rich repeat domain-containing protein [Ruminococcus sp.]
MQCENCHAEIPKGSAMCPECRTIMLQKIQGYDATKQIQTLMRSLVEEQFENIANTDQLISMTYDYLAGYDFERAVIVRMLKAGVLDVFLKEPDRHKAVDAARELMTKDVGANENQAEFVLAVFSYMTKLPYLSKLHEDEKKKDDSQKPKEKAAVDIDSKVYRKKDAFLHKLSKTIIVKEGYTRLDGYCFDGCKMRSISLPSTLMAVGEYSFTDCKKLISVKFPDSVKKIEKGAFNACLSLESVKLPKNLLEIGDNTFFCCTSLKVLTVPDTVSGFGENAFSGCESLEALIVPRSVKFIDKNAFAYCPKLVVYCYENSYVHKYCMQHKIKFVTSAVGTALPADEDFKEEESDDRA